MSLAHNSRVRKQRAQSGFTLVEVLVTFVILAIGLLGIVSLQALSKTSQHQSIQRTRAVSMADIMLERIRINPAGLVVYATNGSGPLGGDTIGSEPSPDCVTASCNPNNMAAHDLWEWEQLLDGDAATVGGAGTAGLIQPQACIIFSAVPGKLRTGLLSVQVEWRGLSETTDGVPSGGVVCGGATAGSDAYRRQVTASTFVLDEAEL